MSDLICRKTMMRCPTPGMCAPFGGCSTSAEAARNSLASRAVAPAPAAGVPGLSAVKRYALNISRPPYGLEPVQAGKLVMYDDHAAALSAIAAERDQLRAENVRLAEWYSEAGVREDALRAERDQARQTAEHWKAEHLAGNAVIDQLRAEVEARRLQADTLAEWHANALSNIVALLDLLKEARPAVSGEVSKWQRLAAVGGHKGGSTASSLLARIDAAMAARKGVPDHVCAGCGAKGWTANCDQCIPY